MKVVSLEEYKAKKAKEAKKPSDMKGRLESAGIAVVTGLLALVFFAQLGWAVSQYIFK